MGIRYSSRQRKVIDKEDEEDYKKLLKKRNRRQATIYKSPDLSHPSPKEISNLETIGHVWSAGDRFSKLAYEHYDDPGLWWVIAWFNQYPTDAHVDTGDTIQIPHPIERILGYLEV